MCWPLYNPSSCPFMCQSRIAYDDWFIWLVLLMAVVLNNYVDNGLLEENLVNRGDNVFIGFFVILCVCLDNNECLLLLKCLCIIVLGSISHGRITHGWYVDAGRWLFIRMASAFIVVVRTSWRSSAGNQLSVSTRWQRAGVVHVMSPLLRSSWSIFTLNRVFPMMYRVGREVGYIIIALLQIVCTVCQWKFWKLVNNWRGYGHKWSGTFLRPTV